MSELDIHDKRDMIALRRLDDFIQTMISDLLNNSNTKHTGERFLKEYRVMIGEEEHQVGYVSMTRKIENLNAKGRAEEEASQ